MKQIGPRGDVSPYYPLGSANEYLFMRTYNKPEKSRVGENKSSPFPHISLKSFSLNSTPANQNRVGAEVAMYFVAASKYLDIY